MSVRLFKRAKTKKARSNEPHASKTIGGTALPWAYEVSCRARTGSVLRKVSLDERFVIRPVFRSSETVVPPRHSPLGK
jgi:hypothetical protein